MRISSLFVFVGMSIVLLAFGCSSGGGNEGPQPPVCQADSCFGHGECTVVGMELRCDCSAGYMGEDCSACAAGYQDNDGDGVCSADCFEHACPPHAACDDSSGTAVCSCDEGYQDNDADELCQATCATAALDCSGHGDCADESGTAVCVCDEGYTGTHCANCAAGYQDHDGDGTCLPDCSTTALICEGHSHCVDDSGQATCVCDEGYQGTDCDACAPGYLDLDGDGVCEEGGTGESCDSPLALDTSGSSVTGSTNGMTNNQAGSCAASDGPEMVYVFSLGQNMDVQFSVSAGFDTVMYLRSDCDAAGSQIACDDDGGQGTNSALSASLAPGTYFLFVDGYNSGDSGSFNLSFDFACGSGLLFDAASGTCVDDPCDPNPCTLEHKTRCEVVTADYSYTCSCSAGYIDDGAGGCEEDPNANQWLFAVYMNGDNDLDAYADSDLQEIISAGGSDPMVHVVILKDSWSGPANVLYATAQGAETVEAWGEVNMGDWTTMRDFGVWAVQNYPAQKVALILWDHGDGWRAPGGSSSSLFKGFSIDMSSNDSEISVANGEYAQALAGITGALGRKLDLVGFDACLMGAWELAVATEPYADVLVASSETEPADGWPYHGFLPALKANPTMDAASLGQAIVQAYHDDSSMNSTLSVTDLTSMDDLLSAISSLADALMANPSAYSQAESARSASTDFGWDPDTRDLGEFASRLANASGLPAAVSQAAAALRDQVDASVLFHLSNSGYGNTRGLSTYFPGGYSSFDDAYQGSGAVWSQQSSWDEFLVDFN